MTKRSGFALSALPLLLAACQQETPATIDPAPSASASASTATSDVPAVEGRQLTLTSTSVILINGLDGRGAATTLNFDTSHSDVIAAMSDYLGAPKTGALAECGAGPMEFATFGGLTLNFLEGRFAGWRAERADNLVTVDGIRPGIPFAKLKTELPAEMANSTLEGEFSYQSPDGGMIGGFVDPQGTVVSLHAGTTCFFR